VEKKIRHVITFSKFPWVPSLAKYILGLVFQLNLVQNQPSLFPRDRKFHTEAFGASYKDDRTTTQARAPPRQQTDVG
jgi:hypothetical protein